MPAAHGPSLLRCYTCKKGLRQPTVCGLCCRPTHRDCWDGDGCGVCIQSREAKAVEDLAAIERTAARSAISRMTERLVIRVRD